jgi:hypothetical protein
MKPRQRLCPTCKGIVTPVKRGQDPDEALAKHIRLAHTKE